tara:strand:- start:25 stop:978 length:954 start_codon:yes stop_codon:yes gene_type:complete
MIKKFSYFITGGAGFIGSNIIEFLIKEKVKKITVIDDLSFGKIKYIKKYIKNKRINFIKGSILNKKKINKCIKKHDVIIHLSANADIASGNLNPKIDFNQTVKGTFTILEAMRTNNIKKLIFLSGSGVYGDYGSAMIKENFTLFPASIYGASKLCAESLISSYVKNFLFSCFVLRPANIVGQYLTHGVVFDFIKKLKKNPTKLRVLGDGNQTKPYIIIDDIISAIKLLINKRKFSPKKLEIYNISNKDRVSVKDIAKLTIKFMKLKKTKIIYGKTKYGWIGDIPQYKLNINKLEKIGWKNLCSSSAAIKKTLISNLN